jgi:pSer/pThr/pTyr-binding forkhead associated (FHA) protein
MVDDDFYIMDLSSTNGTFVNGKQLTPAKPEKIFIGSEVVFGAPSTAHPHHSNRANARGAETRVTALWDAGDEFLARFELREE